MPGTCQGTWGHAVPSDPLPIIEGVRGGTYVPLAVTSGKTCPRFASTL